MIKIYFASTDLIQKNDSNNLTEQLSPLAKSRLASLKRDEDKNLLLTSSVLLTHVLCENGHNNYKTCDLQYSTEGRPFFPGSRFDFNISHTDNCVAIVFSGNCRVGIDIERIKEVDLSDFEDMFSKEVWNDIYAAKDKVRKFYCYWTLLESAVKADGRGLSLVSQDNTKIVNDQVLIEGKRWFSRHSDLSPTISCCITSDKEIETVGSLEILSIWH